MFRKLLRRSGKAQGDDPVRRVESALAEGRPDQAETILREYLAAHDADVAALHRLGVVTAASGRPDVALDCFEQVIVQDPRRADTWRCRADALLALGRRQDAASSYQAAVELAPGDVESLAVLGQLLLSCNRPQDAVAAFEQALRMRDDMPVLHLGRATALMRAGRPDAALDEFRIALECDPHNLDAALGLGATLHYTGRTLEALACYDRLQTQFPAVAAIPHNRGILLRMLRHGEDAAVAFRQAVALDPAHRDAWHNLGVVLSELLRFDEAAQCAERLVELDPQYPHALGNLAYWRASIADWTDRAALIDAVRAGVGKGQSPCVPFISLMLSDDADAQLACAARHVADRHPVSGSPLCPEAAYEHPRLRIAYVSADFREHAVAYLMAGVLERHDRRGFEIFGVALGGDDRSAMRRRIASGCEHFIDVGGRTDGDVASLLRAQEIDIAVDLMGHTGESRPGIFALRPAPVQVNYLGYPGTTGTEYIDYIVADRHVVPEARQAAYSEKVVYLPETFQANDRDGRPLPAAATRAEAGLPEGRFVFCCFNNTYKIGPEAFDAWMRMLGAVPGSVLWLLAGNAGAAANLRREAAARGIAPDRLFFADRVPYATHLARLALADVFLDTLPFNGGTTVSDALWAAVPVVTRAGDAFAARMATSLLHAVGLSELVTTSAREYETKALQLAREPAKLAALRELLVASRERAPLFDTARFCAHLEAAYRAMADRARRLEPASALRVESLPGC